MQAYSASCMSVGIGGERISWTELVRQAQCCEKPGEKAPWRNGYKDRSLKTAEGPVEIRLPQSTQRLFGSCGPPEGNSSELERLVTENVCPGLSTRILRTLHRPENGKKLLSKSQASQISDCLNEEYLSFTERDLSGFDVVYLFLDAVYEPLRRVGRGRKRSCVASGQFLPTGRGHSSTSTQPGPEV